MLVANRSMKMEPLAYQHAKYAIRNSSIIYSSYYVCNACIQGNRDATFSYGSEGMAKYQLNALAAHSQEAMQIVTTSCSLAPVTMHGWNGNQFNIKDYSWNTNYSVDKSMDCQVDSALSLM